MICEHRQPARLWRSFNEISSQNLISFNQKNCCEELNAIFSTILSSAFVTIASRGMSFKCDYVERVLVVISVKRHLPFVHFIYDLDFQHPLPQFKLCISGDVMWCDDDVEWIMMWKAICASSEKGWPKADTIHTRQPIVRNHFRSITFWARAKKDSRMNRFSIQMRSKAIIATCWLSWCQERGRK